MISKKVAVPGIKHVHTLVHAHTHTHACMCVHTHTHTLTHIHTHTHTQLKNNNITILDTDKVIFFIALDNFITSATLKLRVINQA